MISQQLSKAPREPAVAQDQRGGQRIARLTWQTAFAGDRPIARDEIWRDREPVGRIEHKPQVSKSPFSFEDRLADHTAHGYRLVSVDQAGRRAETEELRIPSMT